MSPAENTQFSPHLVAERDRLLHAIIQIRQAGNVAQAHCWLIEKPDTKGERTYTYVYLVTEPPGKQKTSKSLGKPGSEKHRDWKKAIVRRDAIAELEQQLKLLEALIDRQAATAERVAIALIKSESPASK